jgi:hypothetical protein
MRKILLIFAFISILISCSKDNEAVADLPKWLKEKIDADEKEITADPKSGKDLGAWIQYSYADAIYYEYHNLLMSSLPKVYRFDGSELNYAQIEYQDYQNEKCCKKFVWKGKSYFED